jgi:hypothetical protein
MAGPAELGADGVDPQYTPITPEISSLARGFSAPDDRESKDRRQVGCSRTMARSAARRRRQHAGDGHRAPVDQACGMNGRELAEEIARRRPGTRVLFTSGYTENAIVHHGRLDPGVALLNKPYRKKDLAEKVRGVLDGVGVA